MGQELMAIRWAGIQQKYVNLGGKKSNIMLHNLPMPLVFRSRGGIGTHWMMPNWVTLRDPRAVQLADATSVQVTADLAKRLVMGLTSSNNRAEAFDAVGDVRQAAALRDWVDHDPFMENWRLLVNELRGDSK